MIGCLRTRVRKQPIMQLILSLRMNSSFITSRPGVHRVATQNDKFAGAFVCQNVCRNKIVLSQSLQADTF